MEFMFFVFLVWMAFAVGVGYLASARGRSGAGWGFLSLLVSPVICLIALLLLPDLVA
jgi:hypothetical protein